MSEKRKREVMSGSNQTCLAGHILFPLLVECAFLCTPLFHSQVSTNLTKMPSQMEHAMETMMFTFHKFAGDKGYLTKEDLRVLMEKEFPGFLENQKDPLAVDKIMKDLDQCRDGKVGFQSFFSLIAGLTIACNDYFVVHMKQKGRK
uniref:Protein S100-A10 n=1 Tax=Equus caballus TaxID=9796 RepID=F7BKY7_HORSE